MPVPGVPKPAFKQECRKAVSEDPRNQKLTGVSSHHPPGGGVLKRNGFGQVFNMESKDKAPRNNQPMFPSRVALVSARPCTESQEPSSACIVCQSLKMTFTRTQGDCWTSRLVEGAPGPLTEKQTPPSESPVSQEKGEGARSLVPWSVLYEDLLVSSSSEDSDGEWAFPWKEDVSSLLKLPRSFRITTGWTFGE
ncbi:hypothetical protein I79_006136 [Cricetulus griseus]|uniref:Uncharacterized protein n=1 Tax=Cricetulus griseus TaxID=10029 RepID=G3H711_CRIGR|nr:hypothetical protein I79_006136 [Cricetulus griseus]